MINKQNSIAVFDGQVFQSAAWDRGMGKYSLCLLGALMNSKKYRYDKTYIIFTSHLPLKEEAMQIIKKAAPNAEFTFLDLGIPNIHDHASIKPLEKRNTKELDKFINNIRSGNTDIAIDFTILSLFIDQVCSVFPSLVKKILLFYDLIPLQYSERYGQFHNYANYLARFRTVLAADYIWTISQMVADDLMVYMGINPKKLCNINGAPIERKHQTSERPTHVNIPPKFLLTPSGNDLRKNNLRTVKAFEEYRRQHPDEDIYLVITSFFDDGTRNTLLQESDRLIFTGNVTEGELRWLYEQASALLFVPEYEGLGLPILEAIETECPIVCSNLTVFGEMSKTAFYYADQFDPQSIAGAIDDAVQKKGWDKKKKEYPAILRRYTWPKAADAALEFIDQNKKLNSREVTKKKYKLAIFTPDPSGYSAIGKFNLHLHPALSEYFDIDYYVEKGVTGRGSVRPSYLGDIANVYSAKVFNNKRYSRYDATIYHIGNSEFHLDTIKNALYLPGYAIMHDTNLKAIFSGELLAHKYITDERLTAEDLLDEVSGVTRTSHATSILNAQIGVLAHSHYAEDALKEARFEPSISIHTANLPIASPVLEKLKIDKEFAIGFAGIIHPAKGLNLLDEIVNSGMFDNAKVYLFGIPLVSNEELYRIEALPNVTVLTNLTDFQFQSKLADIDVLVNYRPHYNGEASAATIEAMRLGVVPIVRKIGWFDELPDDSVVKVTSESEVTKALADLYTDDEKRKNISSNARKHMQNKFSQAAYAKNLFNLIDHDLSGQNKSKNISIAQALHNKHSKRDIRDLL